MVGGCVEYLALSIGFRHLLLVAGVSYLAAFALLPGRVWHSAAGGPSARSTS
jgi:hypothetical protein